MDATTLMVRLHDLAFSLGELEKARTTLVEAIDKEELKLTRVFKAKATEDVQQALPKLSESVVRGMIETIDQGIKEANETIVNTAELVGKYLGINLVFIQEKENLFERLYMPTARDFP